MTQLFDYRLSTREGDNYSEGSSVPVVTWGIVALLPGVELPLLQMLPNETSK